MSGSKISFRQRIALEAHRSYRRKCVAEHKLNTLFWECTLKCNLACKHCGSDCHVDSDAKELSGEEFLRVVDSITPHVDPHKVLVIFTGGEALVRQDLDAIGLELYRRGYPWGLVTNGMLLNEERLESLLRSGLHSLTISLDGFEEAHNYLRGHHLSFARASHAVELMAKTEQVRWDVVTCVNPMNFGYLAEFRDYLIGLGLKGGGFLPFSPWGERLRTLICSLAMWIFTTLWSLSATPIERGALRLPMVARAFWADLRARYVPIPILATQVWRWLLSSAMVRSVPARVSASTISRAMYVKMTSGPYGRIASSPIAIGVGLAETSVPSASSGVTARGMECTCTTTRASSSSATISDFCAPKHH